MYLFGCWYNSQLYYGSRELLSRCKLYNIYSMQDICYRCSVHRSMFIQNDSCFFIVNIGIGMQMSSPSVSYLLSIIFNGYYFVVK